MKDKVILVVDFYSSIGENLAETLSLEKAKVMFLNSTKTGIKSNHSTINENIWIISVDEVTEGQFTLVRHKIIDQFNHLDVIIHNCIPERNVYFLSYEPIEIKRNIDITVKSSLLLAKTFIPIFLKQKKGLFISIVPSGPYTLTLQSTISAGVTGMDQALRNEVKRSNIKVTSIYWNPCDDGVDAVGPSDFKDGLRDNLKQLNQAVLFAYSQSEQASLDELIMGFT